ncbi:MAG: N-acetylmuramoyl-L-alanine amidase [Candidatus Levybacteria bacterium]|nr:N-acetylmuramoyl-L-alanine amidase [Candidatus Levybacteria bacterium]
MDDNTAQKKRSQVLKATAEWEGFRKSHGSGPDNKTQFYEWAIKVGVDPQYWWNTKQVVMFGIPQASTPPTHQQPPEHAAAGHGGAGVIGAVGMAAVLLSKEKPDLMEDDNDYKKIEERRKKEWLEKNNRKDFNSKEGLDFLYGSLDDPTKPSLNTAVEQEFREKFDKKAKQYDEKKKRVYKNIDDDPALQATRAKIDTHATARHTLAKAVDPSASFDEIHKRVERVELERFAAKHPERAKVYVLGKEGEKYPELARAYDTVQTKEITGKEIRHVEKAHPQAPTISQEEAARRLEQVLQQPPAPSGLVGPTGIPLPSSLSQPSPPQTPQQQEQGGAPSASRVGQAARNWRAALTAKKTEDEVAKQAVKKAIWRLPGFWYAVGVVSIIIILFIFIFSLGAPLGGPGGLSGTPTTGVGGDIASCTFYRGGDKTEGYKFRIPEWPALINEVSSKVGVPASIVAGILRVESATNFYTNDPTYIGNDYDDHFSTDDNGNPVAYGAMQLTPGTFKATFDANRAEMQSFFGKTEASNKFGVSSLAEVEPNNLLRIYSVRDSVIAAAFKVKIDKKSINGDKPWDEAAVREIARSYYGACGYYQNGRLNNYCDDLWKSYSGCINSTIANACLAGSGSATGSKTVVLNPGHAINSTDPELGGAAGEAEKNTELAKKIKGRLRAKNYQALLARPDESGVQTFNPANRYNDYQQRIDFANDYNDKNPNGGPTDLYVEIHFDAGAGGPYSFYSDRRIIVDSAGAISPNPNIITPNVDQWIAESRKINTLITTKIAEAIKSKYGTAYQSDREIADHACIGRSCGGHLFTIGPQGVQSNPNRPESMIQRENKAVSAYIETLGMSNPYANDLDLLADAYTDAIAEYLGASSSTTTASCTSSCPLQGTRTISCGSFMSDSKFNVDRCKGPQPIDRGHCGLNYGCYKTLEDGTIVKMTDPTEISSSRRSHAIDVSGQPGDKVKLPTINGNVVAWNYAPSLSYSVADSDGGGYGHVFTANFGGDRWTLHLLHTKPPPIFPIPTGRTHYQSGDDVTEIENTGYPHVHVNLGKNPESNNGGRGWLNPEDLGMCVSL